MSENPILDSFRERKVEYLARMNRLIAESFDMIIGTIGDSTALILDGSLG